MISKSRKTLRILFSTILLFPVLFSVGCIQKTVFPVVLMTVTAVTPYEVKPTLPVGSAAVTLSAVSVSLKADTQVPANLKGYSVTYQTKLGDDIPQIAVPFTPLELILTVGGTTIVSLSPYTQDVVTLFNNTNSQISPILATMHLDVKDVNGNTVTMVAHCLLHKPQ